MIPGSAPPGTCSGGVRSGKMGPMSDGQTASTWTLKDLRSVVLADPPWRVDPRHNCRSLTIAVVRTARTVLPTNSPSPLSGIRCPSDYLGVLKALAEHGTWLSEPGQNPWSTDGYGYSNQVLTFAYDQARRQRRRPNEVTDTGVELFEEFIDLFFDLGLPLSKVIHEVRNWCAAEILGPGKLSLRSIMKDNYFHSQGAADIVKAVGPLLVSRAAARMIASSPADVLPMEELTDVFLSKVRLSLERVAAGTSELKNVEGKEDEAEWLIGDLEERFPGGGRRPGRTKNAPDAQPMAEPRSAAKNLVWQDLPENDAAIEAKSLLVQEIEVLVGRGGGRSVCADTLKVMAERTESASPAEKVSLLVASAALESWCSDPEGFWDGCVSAATAYVQANPELKLHANDLAADARECFSESLMEAGRRCLQNGDSAFSADEK